MNRSNTLWAVLKLTWEKGVFIWIFTILFFVLAALIEPTFRSPGNVVNLFRRSVPFVLVGIAQSMVLISGDFDLSLGAIMSLSTVLAATYMEPWGVVPALVLLAGAGLLVGTINGLFVGFAHLPSLMVTPSTSAISFGISLFIMPVPGGYVPYEFARGLTGTWWGFPAPIVIVVAVSLLMTAVLFGTRYGRWVFATGGNERVARTNGIPTGWIKVQTFAISGLLAAAAGLFLSARMVSGDPLSGRSFMLDSFVVAVLGGTSLMGGAGSVLGVLPAAFVLLIIQNILNLLNVSSFYQFIVRGLILIGVLMVQGVHLERYLPRGWMGVKPD